MTSGLADRNSPPAERTTVGTGYPIVIIDDHELFSTALAMGLSNAGYDARSLVAAGVPDLPTPPGTPPTGLVVLDLDLGRDADGRSIDGADLVRDIQAKGWSVLIVSGEEDDAAIAAAIVAGAIGYVAKTRSFGTLTQVVTTAATGIPIMTEAEHDGWLRCHRRKLAHERDMSARFAYLTQREREVLDLLAEGHRAAAIADRFFVSMPTVRTHIRSILVKLQVGSQLEAVALLRQQRDALVRPV